MFSLRLVWTLTNLKVILIKFMSLSNGFTRPKSNTEDRDKLRNSFMPWLRNRNRSDNIIIVLNYNIMDLKFIIII